MTKFAAYDENSIYAVADSRESAIQQARSDEMAPEEQFSTAPISELLAAQIKQNGWNGLCRSFDLDKRTGYLIDTTRWIRTSKRSCFEGVNPMTYYVVVDNQLKAGFYTAQQALTSARLFCSPMQRVEVWDEECDEFMSFGPNGRHQPHSWKKRDPNRPRPIFEPQPDWDRVAQGRTS